MWRSKQAWNRVSQLQDRGEKNPETVFYGREKNPGLGGYPGPPSSSCPEPNQAVRGHGQARPVDKSHRGIASPSHARRNRGINWLQLAKVQLHTIQGSECERRFRS